MITVTNVFPKLRIAVITLAVWFFLYHVAMTTLSFINYFGHSDDFRINVDLPILLGIRIPCLIASFLLAMGASRSDSTPIAIFLWVMLEANLCLIMLYSYHYRVIKRAETERLLFVIGFSAQSIMWLIVNYFHNLLKKKEQEQLQKKNAFVARLR